MRAAFLDHLFDLPITIVGVTQPKSMIDALKTLDLAASYNVTKGARTGGFQRHEAGDPKAAASYACSVD